VGGCWCLVRIQSSTWCCSSHFALASAVRPPSIAVPPRGLEGTRGPDPCCQRPSVLHPCRPAGLQTQAGARDHSLASRHCSTLGAGKCWRACRPRSRSRHTGRDAATQETPFLALCPARQKKWQPRPAAGVSAPAAAASGAPRARCRPRSVHGGEGQRYIATHLPIGLKARGSGARCAARGERAAPRSRCCPRAVTPLSGTRAAPPSSSARRRQGQGQGHQLCSQSLLMQWGAPCWCACPGVSVQSALRPSMARGMVCYMCPNTRLACREGDMLVHIHWASTQASPAVAHADASAVAQRGSSLHR